MHVDARPEASSDPGSTPGVSTRSIAPASASPRCTTVWAVERSRRGAGGSPAGWPAPSLGVAEAPHDSWSGQRSPAGVERTSTGVDRESTGPPGRPAATALARGLGAAQRRWSFERFAAVTRELARRLATRAGPAARQAGAPEGVLPGRGTTVALGLRMPRRSAHHQPAEVHAEPRERIFGVLGIRLREGRYTVSQRPGSGALVWPHSVVWSAP
jgi:hypothetical protein